jgi:hypothetical protein
MFALNPRIRGRPRTTMLTRLIAHFPAPALFLNHATAPTTNAFVSTIAPINRQSLLITSLVSAIANYTTRVATTSLSATQRQEALKFLDHFLGDIGQPLHVENYEVGGNDISVKCSGSTSNLHAVWDSGILNKNVNANYGGSASTYANTLVARIKTGAYKSSAASWISCSSTTKTARGPRSIEDDVRSLLAPRATITPLACPLVWAQDANSLDCVRRSRFFNVCSRS